MGCEPKRIPNEELICIKELQGFTLNRIYKVYRAANSNILKIIDDDGFVDTISDEFFISMSEFRDSKIDDILG
jgi:zona occludens toxin (predicted ATPase)